MAKGRRKVHFETASGETVVGLNKLGEGRYRVTLDGPHKGKRFNASDERMAVARFRQIVGAAPSVEMQVGRMDEGDFAAVNTYTKEEGNNGSGLAASLTSILEPDGSITFSQRVDEAKIWEWCRNQIISDPGNAARKLDLPAIGNLDYSAKFITPIGLDLLINTYDKHAPSNWRTKGQARSAFKRLKASTKATTIPDLTTPKLIDFRAVINSQLAPAGAAQVFAKIKAVFAFGIKYGLDSNQIAPALARLKTLYAPRSTSTAKPQPISKGDFHKLLKGADPVWRAILLTSLNMALYVEDVCELRWADFNLEAGTYVGKRAKTSVVRVGWLWPETVAALKALPRKGESPLVLTSTTGIRYPASTRYAVYKVLREKVGVDAPFSSIRDGGYSAAAAACDEKTAKVFAAHRFGGLMDSYVQRRPDIVKPAADAVYAAYGPFPAPTFTS